MIKWGKYVDDKMEFIPDVVDYNGKRVTNPTRSKSLCKALGYRPVLDRPSPRNVREGHHYEADGYHDVGGCYYITRWRLVKDPAPTVADFDKAMEEHLTSERSARGYTTREPDAYLASDNERWAQDAKDWVAHRDDVMDYALQVMNAVSAGTRKPPTISEFLDGLPRIEWTYPT